LAQREQKEFEVAEQSLRQAMQDMPELAALSKNLIIDQTPEGLRIQIVDQEGRPMFPPGAVEPYERTSLLLNQVAKVILRLPNRISVSGHTDSAAFATPAGYTNWDLSADRANASRRVLQSAGVPNDRIYQVSGKAGSEPLFPNDPYLVGNRRISIVLLREAPVLPPSMHR
jgi:chemotaxis protein MotB